MVKEVKASTIIVIGVVFRIVLVVLLRINFWSDESTVTLISEQPAGQLLNTILAEPHPPVFYFLLKTFPVDNQILSRLLITIISSGATLGAVYYASRNGVIKKYQLGFGVSLFFCSTTFLTITSDLKQDSLSFPLLLFFLLVTLDERMRVRRKQIVSVILLAALLFTGYIPFFWAVFLMVSYYLFAKNYGTLVKIVVLQFAVVLVYFLAFGGKQLENNLNRFEWTNYEPNNPLLSLTLHISGYQNLAFGFVGLVFIVLGGIEFYRIYTHSKQKLFLLLFLVGLFLIPLLAELYVRSRYSYPAFALVTILAGWFIQRNSTKKLQTLILFCMLILGVTGYIDHKLRHQGFREDLIDYLVEATKEENVFFISDTPYFPLVFARSYLESEKIIPINSSNMNVFRGADTIVKEDLLVNDLSLDEAFQKSPMKGSHTKIVHLHSIYAQDQYDKIRTVLDKYCVITSKKTLNTSSEVVVYSSCN